MTAPRYSSGTSIVTASTGSWILPSISRVTTCGLPTVSSKPSRRMISTRTASWSSPRACTSQASGRSVVEHPQRHVADELAVEPVLDLASGQLVAALAGERRRVDADVIDRLGSSTVMTGSGRGSSRSAQRFADRDVGEPGDGDDLAGGRRPRRPRRARGSRSRRARRPWPARSCRRPCTRRRSGRGACSPFTTRHDGEAADVGRGVEVGDPGLQGMPGLVRGRGDRARRASANSGLEVGARRRPGRAVRRAGAGVRCRRSGTRSGARRRRGRGTARTTSSTTSPMRASGRSILLTTSDDRQVGARAPCAARSGSAAAGPRWRRRAAARRRPS